MSEEVLIVSSVSRVLGRLIEHHRSAKRLSQTELASKCGLSRTYISDIERGLRNFSVVSLCKIAAALELRASQLISEAEIKVGLEVPSLARGPRIS